MSQKIRHPSMERLYSLAKDAGVTSPSTLAIALGESEQVVANWGRRGLSKVGAMKAQRYFGCNANWVMHGTESAVIKDIADQTKNEITSELSNEAMILALLFDKLPNDRIKRMITLTAASALILQALQPDETPPIAELVLTAPQKK